MAKNYRCERAGKKEKEDSADEAGDGLAARVSLPWRLRTGSHAEPARPVPAATLRSARKFCCSPRCSPRKERRTFLCLRFAAFGRGKYSLVIASLAKCQRFSRRFDCQSFAGEKRQ